MEIKSKSLSEFESENGIVGTLCDISHRYLGLPPSKRFYKKEEVDFSGTRKRFAELAKRLGVIRDVDQFPH
jgi:hypothetical protein